MSVQFPFCFSTCRKLQNIRIAKSNKPGQNEAEFLSGSKFSFVICSKANFKLIHFFISYRFRQQLYDQHVLKQGRRCYYHSSQSNHEHAKKHGKGVVTFTTIYDPEEVGRVFAVLVIIQNQILSNSFKSNVRMRLTKLFV